MNIPIYSENLVQLARSVDRLAAAPRLARSMTNDIVKEFRRVAEEFEPDCIQFLPHNTKRLEHSFKATEACLPFVQQLFVKMLLEESHGSGVLEIRDGEIIVPDWVSTRFVPYEDSHIRQSHSEVAALVATGKKIIWMGNGDYYDLWCLPEETPDSFIEVWWGRCHPYADGFLIKGDLGWQFYCLEE